ncbi:MAG TPA: hypothetical protein DCF33_22705 [Saprospirales bacterium]|nr:hypothetical protein [Saprospirales bacterium]
MQKLIKDIVLGHGLYVVLLLLLGGYVLYVEYYNQEGKLKEVLTQDLQVVGNVFFANYRRLHGAIIKSSETYPFEQAEHYCNRLIHLEQQSDSLRQWITNGIAGKHKPYFPALKEAYNNQVELATIYCDEDIGVKKSLSAFNPEIAPLQKFDGSHFLEHAQIATMINQLISANYFATKVAGIDSNCWAPFNLSATFDNLNFSDNNWIQSDIILGIYRPYLNNGSIAPRLFLNHQEFPIKDGIAPFKYRFDTPGIHPLQVRWQYNHPNTDSVTVFEKTYYVKVDKP